MRSFQRLIFSNNELEDLGIDDCSSPKISLETIDLSNNQLYEGSIIYGTFFQCLGSEKLILKGNYIGKVFTLWEFFDKSLKIIDLKHNRIDRLFVSLIFLNKFNEFFAVSIK